MSSALRERLGALERQILQEQDALGERLLEVDFAAHGARGDGGDFRLLADELRELVDELALHERGIDVHADEALVAAEDVVPLHGEIDAELDAEGQELAASARISSARGVVPAGKSTISSSPSSSASLSERISRMFMERSAMKRVIFAAAPPSWSGPSTVTASARRSDGRGGFRAVRAHLEAQAEVGNGEQDLAERVRRGGMSTMADSMR